MKKIKTGASLLLAGSLAVLATGASAQNMGTQADVVENFPAPDSGLLSPENATITRRADSVHVHMDLTTPKAGTYTYPEGIGKKQKRQPEVFTGWAFVSQVNGGKAVLNLGTDGYVRLAGDIMAGQEQRNDLPPGATTFALENPMGAEIHAAIAPHGRFDNTTIRDELYNPTGNPACGCWWVAIFESPEAPQDTASN